MKARYCSRALGKVRPVWLVLVLAAIVVIALAAACGEQEEENPSSGTTPGATANGVTTPAADVPGITDREIVLGADCPLSGAMAAVYAMIPQAVGAYFDYVNDTQGGVCGREIVYKVEDNQDDPAKGIEAVRKLVERDEVFALVGSLGDSPHSATWEYLNDEGVPDILCSAGTHMFGADPEGHPWTVQMIPSYQIEATFFGQYISENLPGKKVGVLYPNIAMGTDLLQGMRDGLDPEKNEIVSEEAYELTAVSVGSQMITMKNAGAEVVITNATPGFTAQAINQASRLGWEPDWFISYINSDETMFQFVSPELLEGAISLQALKLATWSDDAAMARHYEIMAQYGGPSPTNFSVYAQTLAEVAVEALNRTCDNLTREGLMAALESIQDFHSDLFIEGVNVSFSDTDHTAFQSARMLRATAEDGKGKWEYFGPLFVFE